MELDYHEAAPRGRAAEFIRCVWALRGHAADAAAPDPIVSDGCVELVFNLADPFEHLDANATRSRQPLALVVGPTARPTVVRPTGRIEVVGVRLQPWAGAILLGVPMGELRDRQLALSELRSGPLAELPERLQARAIPADRLRHALDLLPALLPRETESVAHAAVCEIPLYRGEAPTVRQLADRLGTSARTLERAFATHVGLAPRTLLRIVRIQRALLLARAHRALRWSSIAVRAGYYDQSHFVRDFKELVGRLPSEFRPDQDTLTTSFLTIPPH